MLSEQTKTSNRHHIKFGRSGQWQRCWQRARSGAGGTQAPVTREGAGWVQKGPNSGTEKDRRLENNPGQPHTPQVLPPVFSPGLKQSWLSPSEMLQVPAGLLRMTAQLPGEKREPLFLKPEGVPQSISCGLGAPTAPSRSSPSLFRHGQHAPCTISHS